MRHCGAARRCVRTWRIVGSLVKTLFIGAVFFAVIGIAITVKTSRRVRMAFPLQLANDQQRNRAPGGGAARGLTFFFQRDGQGRVTIARGSAQARQPSRQRFGAFGLQQANPYLQQQQQYLPQPQYGGGGIQNVGQQSFPQVIVVPFNRFNGVNNNNVAVTNAPTNAANCQNVAPIQVSTTSFTINQCSTLFGSAEPATIAGQLQVVGGMAPLNYTFANPEGRFSLNANGQLTLETFQGDGTAAVTSVRVTDACNQQTDADVTVTVNCQNIMFP